MLLEAKSATARKTDELNFETIERSCARCIVGEVDCRSDADDEG